MQAWTANSGGNQVSIQPWQQIPETMIALGLTDADGMEQVWFVAGDGRLSGGAAAINEALNGIWWARPFTLFYRLPGIKQLETRIYRWVAANRHRMPGGAPQCKPVNRHK